MLERIKDIQKALDAKAYLAALALALTLPDICGKIAYPNIKNNGEQYSKWFDEHITKNEYQTGYPEKHKINGAKIWKLRCSFLHAGSVPDISDISAFELGVIEPNIPGIYPLSTSLMVEMKDDHFEFHVKLDVVEICSKICIAADDFFNSWADKSAFNDQNGIIIKYQWLTVDALKEMNEQR